MKILKKYNEMFDIKQDTNEEERLASKSISELLDIVTRYDQISYIKGLENSTTKLRDDLDAIGYDWQSANKRKEELYYKTHSVSQFNLYPNGPSHQIETDVTYCNIEDLISQLENLEWEIVKETEERKSIAGSYKIFYMMTESYLIECFVSDNSFINSVGKIIS